MKKFVYPFAILAAAISTAAVAKDLQQEQKATAPAVSATQMNDAEMDRVTAGAAGGQTFPAGFGIGTAINNPGLGWMIGTGPKGFLYGAPGSGECRQHLSC